MSSFDRPHVLVLSYIYELPFARNSTGFTRALLQGWQLSGITRFESGTPLNVTIPGDRAGTGSGGQRPDVIAPMILEKSFARWFSTSSFANPALGTGSEVGAATLFEVPGSITGTSHLSSAPESPKGWICSFAPSSSTCSITRRPPG